MKRLTSLLVAALAIGSFAIPARATTETVFYESFNSCNGSGGNDGNWSGSIASSGLNYDNTGWSATNGNGANKCAKFGSSSKKGDATTPALNAAGTLTLSFKAAAWNASSEKTEITLSIAAGGGTLSQTAITLVKGAWTTYTVTISGATTATKVKFSANYTSNNRFFLDEILVTQEVSSATQLSTPTGLSVSGTPGINSFAVTWDTDANASGYTVTISPAHGSVSVSGTSATFSGLTPSTTYSVSVVAIGDGTSYTDSNAATLTNITTADLAAPVLSAATNVDADTFTANWGAVTGATSYEIDVATDSAFTRSSSAATVLTANFSSTTGWTLSGTGTYTSSPYIGEGSPSIKFDDTDDYAISPDFGSGTKLQFWAYGNNGSGSTFAISGLVNGSWTAIETVTIAQGGDTYEVDLPAGTSQLRFDFSKNVNCALDDVVVTRAATVGSLVVDGQSVNGTSYTATGLTTGATYYYRVRAVAGETVSANSQTASILVMQNVAPVISCDIGPTVTVAVNEEVAAVVTATDSNGTPSLSIAPAAFEEYFDSEDGEGLFIWTPDAEGTNTVTFTATDADDSSLTSTYTLTIVAEDNAPPEITLSQAVVSVNSGETVTITAMATDADGTPALVVDPAYAQNFANGTFTWTPLQSGPYFIVFTATDPIDNTKTSTATLSVTVANVAPTLTVTSTSATTVSVGDTVTATVSATDTYGTPTVTASAGTLANGVFTFTAATLGAQTVTFTAVDPEDSSVTTTANLSIEVGLAAPVLAPVSDVTTNSFTVNWSAVPGANGYMLDVVESGESFPALLPAAGVWELVTDINDLSVGDEVVIAAANYDMALSKTQNNNNRGYDLITKSGSRIAAPGTTIAILTVGEGETTGTWSFYDDANDGYLAAVAGNSNYLHTDAALSAESSWEITIENATTGEATIQSTGDTSKNLLRYNPSGHLFSCYGSGQAEVCLYRHIVPRVVTGTSFAVTGLDASTTYRYRLIAVDTTTGTASPTAVGTETTTAPSPPATTLIVF